MSETSRRTALEPFEHVLARQEPKVPGEPFPMKVYINDLPKTCGDPWKGAYSLHGFWYKFQRGTTNDFRKLSKLSNEQNSFMLCEDSFDVWSSTYGKENLIFITVRNLRLDYIGGVVGIRKPSYCQIGFYFIQEDYRHSLIGQQLFRHLAKDLLSSKTYLAFQSISPLLSTAHKFGLKEAFGRTFNHLEICKPSGYPSLEMSKELVIVEGFENLSDVQKLSVQNFDQRVSGEVRDLKMMFSFKFSSFFAAFSKNKCVGFTVCNEILSALHPKPLLVSPLYSQSEEITEALLQSAFNQFYNPDEDYDFDPDMNAIYRRSVHFLVPTSNLRLLPILKKLKGTEGSLISHRLFYQTTITSLLPGCNLEEIDCVGDLFSCLV